jgi:hypothetical protein
LGEAREAGKRPAGAAVKEQRRGGDRLEVRGDPDGWAPPVSERVRKREGVGSAGAWWACWDRTEQAGGGRREGGLGSRRLDRFVFFFFSLLFFQILFKFFSNLFKSNLFHKIFQLFHQYF